MLKEKLKLIKANKKIIWFNLFCAVCVCGLIIIPNKTFDNHTGVLIDEAATFIYIATTLALIVFTNFGKPFQKFQKELIPFNQAIIFSIFWFCGKLLVKEVLEGVFGFQMFNIQLVLTLAALGILIYSIVVLRDCIGRIKRIEARSKND